VRSRLRSYRKLANKLAHASSVHDRHRRINNRRLRSYRKLANKLAQASSVHDRHRRINIRRLRSYRKLVHKLAHVSSIHDRHSCINNRRLRSYHKFRRALRPHRSPVPPIALKHRNKDTVRLPVPSHSVATVKPQARHFANRRTYPHRNPFVITTTSINIRASRTIITACNFANARTFPHR
jgi:hypothetical protein